MAALLVGGKLSDLSGLRRQNITIGMVGVAVTAPFMFLCFQTREVGAIIISQLIFAMSLALANGGIAAWECELWLHEPMMYSG